MTLSRPRLVLLPGEAPIDASLIEPLQEAFEIIQLDDPGQLQQVLGYEAGPQAASVILQHIGEGVAVVAADGSIAWRNNRLDEYDEDVRRQFADGTRRSSRT